MVLAYQLLFIVLVIVNNNDNITIVINAFSPKNDDPITNTINNS